MGSQGFQGRLRGTFTDVDGLIFGSGMPCRSRRPQRVDHHTDGQVRRNKLTTFAPSEFAPLKMSLCFCKDSLYTFFPSFVIVMGHFFRNDRIMNQASAEDVKGRRWENAGLAYALRRAQEEGKPYTCVVIMAGTNDLADTPIPNIVKNLMVMHQTVKSFGAVSVAVGVPKHGALVCKKWENAIGASNAHRLRQSVEELNGAIMAAVARANAQDENGARIAFADVHTEVIRRVGAETERAADLFAGYPTLAEYKKFMMLEARGGGESAMRGVDQKFSCYSAEDMNRKVMLLLDFSLFLADVEKCRLSITVVANVFAYACIRTHARTHALLWRSRIKMPTPYKFILSTSPQSRIYILYIYIYIHTHIHKHTQCKKNRHLLTQEHVYHPCADQPNTRSRANPKNCSSEVRHAGGLPSLLTGRVQGFRRSFALYARRTHCEEESRVQQKELCCVNCEHPANSLGQLVPMSVTWSHLCDMVMQFRVDALGASFVLTFMSGLLCCTACVF